MSFLYTVIPDYEASPMQEGDVRTLLEAIKKTNRFEDTKNNHFSVLLSNDDHVQSLNKTYRGQDKPTNILSFSDDTVEDGITHIGDLVISMDTMQREADDMGLSLNDHMTHLLIHGFLHLLGYDHEDEAEAEEMETIEIEWLASLKIKNPYADELNLWQSNTYAH